MGTSKALGRVGRARSPFLLVNTNYAHPTASADGDAGGVLTILKPRMLRQPPTTSNYLSKCIRAWFRSACSQVVFLMETRTITLAVGPKPPARGTRQLGQAHAEADTERHCGPRLWAAAAGPRVVLCASRPCLS